MDTTTQAQIYLADQRGHSQTPVLRSFHTFNFGPYQADSRAPFGDLHLLNDDSLLAGASLSLTVEQPTDVLVLPINGGLEYKSSIAAGFLEPGQSGVLSLTPGQSYTISNPYEVEIIDLLQLWLARPTDSPATDYRETTFDLTQKNMLLPCFSNPTTVESRAFIGRYDGRAEDTLTVTPAQRVFVFVVQGVFEVQNRLLHERDGLALSMIQGNTVEFEALSNDAIILLILG